MIYSDSRGQSEELHFIQEKRKTCKHSTAEQRIGGRKKEKKTYETKLYGGHLGPHDHFLRKYNVIENRE